MTWDPYGMPNSPAAGPDDHQHRRLPQQQQPASLKALAAVLGGMALLALVFTVAAEAQEDTDTKKEPEAAAQEESTSTAEQESETAAKKEEEPATTGQTQSTASEQQATEQAEAAGPVEGQMVEQPEGTYVASEYIGRSVMSAEGENIGQISDLVISADNRVVGVVIGVGGFLGIGEKPIAVQFDRLSSMTTQDGTEQLALNYTRAELENAPAFVSLADQQRQAEAEQARQQQEQQQEQLQQEEQQEEGSGQSY